MKICYAVIDTNVFLAALISKKEDSATVKVLEAVLQGRITPLYHQEILQEYDEVLHRDKFSLKEDSIRNLMDTIIKFGIQVFPQQTGEIFIDMDDLIFYEVALEKRDEDAYLVTGNQKHYPIRDFIVTSAEMMEIVEKMEKKNRN